jgi:hypothetical protein
MCKMNIQMVEIGKPEEQIEVDPIEDPYPRQVPVPDKEPSAPELVPA